VRIVELVPGYGLCSPSIALMVRPFASQLERISNTGKAPSVRDGQATPLATRIGESN
jgi:hypothetical protein